MVLIVAYGCARGWAAWPSRRVRAAGEAI
jgi:hypothetical protein